MTSAPQSERLLLEAFVLPADEARQRWRRWRDPVDLDTLDPHFFRIIPMLAPRLSDWIRNDPDGNTIRGIIKRAWTQNQLAFRMLGQVAGALREAGVAPVVVLGSAALAVLLEERKAIRPVESIELLVRRDDTPGAVEAIEKLDWQRLPGMPLPEGRELDRRECIWFRDSKDARLKLSWRLLPSSPPLAGSREPLPELVAANVGGAPVELLPPEETLLYALGGNRASCQLDWKWDALALLTTRAVDWKRMRLLLEDEPSARGRLHELHENWPVEIAPEALLAERPGWIRQRLGRIWSDYRWNAWNAGVKPSGTGCLRYCLHRWWRVFVTERGMQ